MKAILFGALMLFLSGFLQGNEVFFQANQDFESGRYKEAIKAYESLLEEGPRVSVLNNLGSAYFRSGDLGRAILAFERALILDPDDPDLRANLKLAQDQAAVYPEASMGGWRGFLGKFSPNTLGLVVLVGASLLPFLAFAVFRFRGVAPWVITAFALVLGVAKMASRQMERQIDPESRGVILATPGSVKLSPFESADTRASLSTGREVKLGEMKNGYYWVDGGGGASQGWIHENDVARLIPGPSSDEP